MSLASILTAIESGETLSRSQSQDCVEFILSSDANPEIIKRILKQLAQRGETIDELVGFTQALRSKMIMLTPKPQALDCCGTGGTGKNRFNISTASAFVCAAMGIPVAKHGNRGSQQANGSFDFLEALGIPTLTSVFALESLFSQTNLCFLFARFHHPAVATVAPLRRELNCRTFFNLTGPLCNPAAVGYQILGTSSFELAQKLAHTLLELGTIHSLVFASEDGSDELNGSVKARGFEITATSIQPWTWDPNTILNHPIATPTGGLAVENAAVFNHLLAKPELTHPVTQTIALNAGVAAWLTGHVPSVITGYQQALEAFATFRVLDHLTLVQNVATAG